MRLKPLTDGRSHDGLTVGPHDHHARPVSVSILDKTTSLPPGTTFDLDVALPAGDYQFAQVHLEGPKVSDGGSSSLWREAAEVLVTRDAGEAASHTIRFSGLKQTYACAYQKQVGDSYLSHKIFDSNTGSSNRYIALQDAVITGSTLRLTFRNFFGGSATLWVQGQAILW